MNASALPALIVLTLAAAPAAGDGPNVVWVVVDDMSPDFACYGANSIETPNLDRLAADGVRFENAFVTGPICSICRSALITGVYQTSLGAQNHRSGRGGPRIRLPDPVRLVPEMMKEAGFHTTNLSFADFIRPAGRVAEEPAVGVAKTDYNFDWDESVHDRTHWAARPEGTPFFAQVQLSGGKHRGQGDGDRWPRQVEKTLGNRTPADAVTLPPYLPDDPVIREDWAQYLDSVRYTDWELGRIVERLRESGELDRTYIFFLTDHGISHVRNKQFLYDGGIRVPLVARGPGLRPGSVRSDLVLQIDLAATTLAAAGLEVPTWMHGRDLFAESHQPREYVVAARDRADETVDHIRCVRTADLKYIKNYFPNRPYLQPNAYKDGKPIVQAMRRLHAEGRLTPEQSLIMAETRPNEELYDLRADPHELRNLAGDPAYADALQALRERLRSWESETGDQGRTPEPPDVYAAEMGSPRGGGRGGDAVGGPAGARNVELMQRWATERPQTE